MEKFEKVEVILFKLNKKICTSCGLVMIHSGSSKYDKNSAALCSSHFLCMKCRLKFFHKRTNRFCKCNKLYSEKEIETLNEYRKNFCTICLAELNNTNVSICKECKFGICTSCFSKVDRSTFLCFVCSARTCDGCQLPLGIKYYLAKNPDGSKECTHVFHFKCHGNELCRLCRGIPNYFN